MKRFKELPSGLLPARRELSFVAALLFIIASDVQAEFVRRSNDTLMLSGRPFYFLGVNAYYLLEQSGRGDTTTVNAVFATVAAMRMNVVRTWGFNDSFDSTNRSVIQYRPGIFNEHALRALDYVVYKAKLNNTRLLIPFVNCWDDYGGMNQYVRWRSQSPMPMKSARYTAAEIDRVVRADSSRQYRYAINAQWGHDDFYSDPTIRLWFRDYVAMMLNRTNIYTGTPYKDEPAIFGWELANEPRSSDASCQTVLHWVAEMSQFIKSIDSNHLVGTGEEGLDASSGGYSISAYNNQHWLFDGSSGASFALNSALTSIDFGSCHLYPESWNLSVSSGNVWIRDHVRIARSCGKPLVIGEFAVRNLKEATYSSWLSTVLLDGAAGGLAWHLLEGDRTDRQGFGIRCSTDRQLCNLLQESALKFNAKSANASLPVPEQFALAQNFPNPFNNVTTISYSLPFDSYIELEVFSVTGERVATLVDAEQSAGERAELFDVSGFASGIYFYRFSASRPAERQQLFVATRKLVVLR